MLDYKKLLLLLITVILVVVAVNDYQMYVAASTIEQIRQTENEKSEIQNELENTQNELDGLKQTHNTLTDELNSLNSQLERVSENLADIEKRMDSKWQEVYDNRAALEEAERYEAIQSEVMVQRIRRMYELKCYNKYNDYLSVLLGFTSLAEIMDAGDCMQMVQLYDSEKIEEYRELKTLIAEYEKLLENDYKELENLQFVAQAEKSKVLTIINNTSYHIDDYADKISEAEAQIAAYENELKQKESDLDELKTKYDEELSLSIQSSNAVKRDLSSIQFEEGDRYLLANLIYCEAGIEPYEGQVAVGSVVINRVLSPLYPNTIVGVIYQKKQFSPVASGKLALALAEDRATDSCYKAADEAMAGVTSVGDCVYFRTPIPGLTGISIGGHIFY